MWQNHIKLVWLTLATIFLSFTGTAAVAAKTEKASAAKKPNILFLFTDDQRADTIHALGNDTIITPNLDRLAEEGFAFDNAYILGSNGGAVCLPSRNMLLSGRAFTRFRRASPPGEKYTARYAMPDKPNVPDALKAAGYETYHHGKKYNTARFIHPRFEHTKYVKHHNKLKNGEPGMVIVDDAIDFLKKRKTDRPFFMYLAFSEPHYLRIPGKKYLDMYDRDKIPLPENYLPIHPFKTGEETIHEEQQEPWPRPKEAIRHNLHTYYGMITGLDHHLGRLLQHLKESGQYDNTIIIFSGDNGLALGSHGLMGKQSIYDPSAKVPLIIAGPGIPHGRTDALVYLLDIFPTLCDMAQTPIPDGLDGKDLMPLMTGKVSGLRDTMLLIYGRTQRALRDGRWKLIRYPRINRTQLFDLKDDPAETRDLSSDPAQAERVASMLDLLKKRQADFGDHLPLTVTNPQSGDWTPPPRNPRFLKRYHLQAWPGPEKARK
ncbi:MAG: sulfatase-like hydrolase/transferase [Planctomycetia bacterium]|jgi:arylsulfatase A-like enzyme